MRESWPRCALCHQRYHPEAKSCTHCASFKYGFLGNCAELDGVRLNPDEWAKDERLSFDDAWNDAVLRFNGVRRKSRRKVEEPLYLPEYCEWFGNDAPHARARSYATTIYGYSPSTPEKCFSKIVSMHTFVNGVLRPEYVPFSKRGKASEGFRAHAMEQWRKYNESRRPEPLYLPEGVECCNSVDFLNTQPAKDGHVALIVTDATVSRQELERSLASLPPIIPTRISFSAQLRPEYVAFPKSWLTDLDKTDFCTAALKLYHERLEANNLPSDETNAPTTGKDTVEWDVDGYKEEVAITDAEITREFPA